MSALVIHQASNQSPAPSMPASMHVAWPAYKRLIKTRVWSPCGPWRISCRTGADIEAQFMAGITRALFILECTGNLRLGVTYASKKRSNFWLDSVFVIFNLFINSQKRKFFWPLTTPSSVCQHLWSTIYIIIYRLCFNGSKMRFTHV